MFNNFEECDDALTYTLSVLETQTLRNVAKKFLAHEVSQEQQEAKQYFFG